MTPSFLAVQTDVHMVVPFTDTGTPRDAAGWWGEADFRFLFSDFDTSK